MTDKDRLIKRLREISAKLDELAEQGKADSDEYDKLSDLYQFIALDLVEDELHREDINVFYLHGFGSAYDPESAKVKALSRLGTVAGTDIDYTLTLEILTEQLAKVIRDSEADLLVGTSMGGYLAARLGALLDVKFVAINPALEPALSLKRHVGDGVDYTGRAFSLSAETVAGYQPFSIGGVGLVLLDSGDELFDSSVTQERLVKHFPVVMFEGGSHRFEHIDDAFATIQEFAESR